MKAHSIEQKAKDAVEAINLAEKQDPCVSQDWEDEATLFRFTDGSVLVVSGPSWKAYQDDTRALEDFPNA